MNKSIVMFTVGLCIGGLTGVLLTKTRYKIIYEQIAEEEIASVKEMVERKQEKVLVMNRDKYKKIANQYVKPDITYNLRTDKEEENSEAEGAYNDGAPYVISVEEFSEENQNYEKLTLYYYEDDDVLTDDAEEVISDVYATVGDDALTSFGDRSEDDEVVYVRNTKSEIDYEIIRLSKSYSETVLGLTEEDRRQARRDYND